MNKRFFIIAAFLGVVLGMQAKVRLPHLIGNDMVLQQNTEVRLWGWAKAGKKVKVTPSWDNNTVSATADKEGRWLVKVKSPVASFTPYSITFDDGDLYTAHCMNEKEFENDESNCRLSVADFKGTKQLKIEVLDFDNEKGKYKTPKIVFDMDELVGSENLSKVKSFSCDITQVAVGDFKGNDGVMLHVPGNLMGTFGSNVGEDCSDWYVPTGSASEYATAEWQCSWVHMRVEGKWLLKGFVDGTTDSTLVFMRWSIPNQADVYIDNLTFYDEDGKSIPIVYGKGEAADETESGDVTSAEDEAPVTEAAPEAEENAETTEETGGENGAE